MKLDIVSANGNKEALKVVISIFNCYYTLYNVYNNIAAALVYNYINFFFIIFVIYIINLSKFIYYFD